MSINYTQKQNRRLVGQELAIVNEVHVVGQFGALASSFTSGKVKLIEVPLQDDPSSIVVTGPAGFPIYTEVTGTPQVGQFSVEYAHGYLTFHSSADYLTVWISYKGRGSEVDAIDINEVQTPIKDVINEDGTVTLHPSTTTPPDGTIQYSSGGEFEGRKAGTWVSLAVTPADLTEAGSGVLSITGGTGAVMGAGTTIEVEQASATQDGYLSSADWSTFDNKQDALGFTPEDVANKDTDDTLAADSDTLYPSQSAVKGYVDTGLSGKENSLGFTPEDVANKSVDGTFASNSDTLYPSEKAVKTYVDAVAQGLIVKAACRYATTADLNCTYDNNITGVGATLTANIPGVFSIDGDTDGSPVATDRILVKDQANTFENGIYTVTDVGSISTPFILMRATDFDNSPVGEVKESDFTFIEDGTLNEHTSWVLTVTPSGSAVTIGITPLIFVQFGSGGGSGGSGGTVIVTTTPYTAVDKQVIFVDATAGSAVVNLPQASSSLDSIYTIKKTDSSVNTVTIDPNGTDLIDGSLTKVLTVQYESYDVVCDGIGWNII